MTSIPTLTPQKIHLDNILALIDSATPVNAAPAYVASDSEGYQELRAAAYKFDGTDQVAAEASELVRGLEIPEGEYKQLTQNDAKFLSNVLGPKLLASSDGRYFTSRVTSTGFIQDNPAVIMESRRPLELHGPGKMFSLLDKAGYGVMIGGFMIGTAGLLAVPLASPVMAAAALFGVALDVGLSTAFTGIATSVMTIGAGYFMTNVADLLGGGFIADSVEQAGRADGPWAGGAKFKAEIKEQLTQAATALKPSAPSLS